jgi:hypothetical protein
MRVGLNSGDVVVRAIGSDLHLDLHGRWPDDAPSRPDGATRRAGDDDARASGRSFAGMISTGDIIGIRYAGDAVSDQPRGTYILREGSDD